MVNAVVKEGEVVEKYEPTVMEEAVCGQATLAQVKTCLEGVVTKGTAHKLQTKAYSFAGKTGTSLVADKGVSYADKMYQSSFAGYFPADKPEYTIVVVIRNKMHAAKFYGGLVAGPVFREVADRLNAGYLKQSRSLKASLSDSLRYRYFGARHTIENLATAMHIRYYDSSNKSSVVKIEKQMQQKAIVKGDNIQEKGTMPYLAGVGLKDALELCEANGWVVVLIGKGKVAEQSVPPGTLLAKGQKVVLTLN